MILSVVYVIQTESNTFVITVTRPFNGHYGTNDIKKQTIIS